jgi:DNA (cytosine-5)-methyltransferase 1
MRVIDLFSGIGGLGLGFKWAGFDIAAAVELDAKRALVYKRNVAPKEVINADVRKVDLSRYIGVDGIIAGPPCEPYSKATPKSRKGVNHPYYGLDIEVVRAVRQVRPRFVVIEEVPAWRPDAVVNELRRLGYAVHAKIYDMSDYGVPMRRRRWIVVAIERGLVKDPLWGIEIPKEAPPRPVDVLAGLPPEPCGVDPCRWNGTIIYNHVTVEINPKMKELVQKIPPGYSLVKAHRAGIIDASKYVANVDNKHSYWLYRVHPDEPLPTVPSPRRSMLLHPTLDRLITVRELARLYTFPDDFVLLKMNIDEMYEAITDSVPPRFSQKLAEALLRVLPR